MRVSKTVTSLATVFLLAGLSGVLTGCGSDADAASDASDVTATSSTPHIVPSKVHKYLQEHDFGGYHLFFHATRQYFIGGQGLRDWLDEQSEKYADLQEGDPGSGIEFLTMHRAMIEHLRENFGSVAVDNDGDHGTFSDVLDGWKTDADVVAAIKKYSASQSTALKEFPSAAKAISDFASFSSEDEFGAFLQTRLRLGEADPDDSFERHYTRDTRQGAGLHNTMHGWFADSSSPIDVGDPALNLSNKMFWGIHGWIEAKWEAFEKVHERTPEEQATFDDLMEKFGLHMQLHSHDVAPPPKGNDFQKELLDNSVHCDDVAEGTTVDGCTSP
jgi:hypothetical protein